tara:strand:- start:12 stop:221 length:210 start_codon:yes stop_codon:yes gene_type:complete
MRLTTILVLIFIPFIYKSQDIVTSIDEIIPKIEFENIHLKKIYSDPFSTTFAIWIKQKVNNESYFCSVY